jgi:hypothetical protein
VLKRALTKFKEKELDDMKSAAEDVAKGVVGNFFN